MVSALVPLAVAALLAYTLTILRWSPWFALLVTLPLVIRRLRGLPMLVPPLDWLVLLPFMAVAAAWPALWPGVAGWIPTLLLVGGITTLVLRAWAPDAVLSSKITLGALLLSALALMLWASWTYLPLAARGVTGSDPYGYIQMALDWAATGSFLHRFPLAEVFQRLDLYPEAVLSLGYRLPLNSQLEAASVWPAGHAWLLGLLVRLAGSEAVYLGTPLLALLTLVAVGWCSAALLPDTNRLQRIAVSVLSMWIVGTSNEYVRWTLVHMADIPATGFTMLAITAAWLAARREKMAALGWAAVAGIALGMAYWVRHTQVVILLPMLAVVLLKCRIHWRPAAIMATTALVTALPDLIYHQQVFGGFLTVESLELEHFTLSAVPGTSRMLAENWFSAAEFLYLLPLLAAGTWNLARRHGHLLAYLTSCVALIVLFQAPYTHLKARDLMPILPILALVTACGVVWLAGRLARRSKLATGLIVLALLSMLCQRSQPILMLPESRAFNNYGFLWATQRAEFEGLRETLPDRAIVGSSHHSGALELYAGVVPFRASRCDRYELDRLISSLQSEGRRVYLLDDSLSMARVLSDVAEFAQLQPAAYLYRLPYYTDAGGSDLRDLTLYEVIRQPSD